MRIQTEEWCRFIPGVRMYKDKKTLFYNGEKLWEGDEHDGGPLVHDEEERDSWQVVIVLPGVEIIPFNTFYECSNVQKVIMADTVKRVENDAFFHCYSLEFVKLSTDLEYIGDGSFYLCDSLTSIFIPPSCTEIGHSAFRFCKKMIILRMPEYVELGDCVFSTTALMKKSPLEFNEYGDYDEEEAVQWIKSINDEDTFALHRACSSFNPLFEIVYALVKRQGIQAMRVPNAIGITPSQYLAANTFADITEKEIINRYIVEMMGEVI